MVARSWTGRTRRADAERYLEVLTATGVKDFRAAEGNLGVLILRRDEADETEWVVLSLWKSEQAIAGAIGPDVSRARYYPEDRPYLLALAPEVHHFEVHRFTGPDA